MHIKSLLVPAAIVCGSLTVALGDGPAPAPNPPNLNAPRNSRVNDFVFTCALGDIDGDGRLDAVAAGEMLHSVRGIGGGWFSDPTQIGFGALHALGDVDRDGDLDLLIYRFGIVEVRLNDGTGNFGDTTTYATGAHPQGDPVDMDGDGILDLVQLGNGSVSIAYGDGNGGFASAEQVVSVGFEPFSAAVADFDGDGRLDVVVGGAADGGAATIIPSAGSRTFGTPVVVGKHVNASGEVKAGDCDGDGHADVITWSQADGVIVFRGKGNLNFKHEKKTPAGDIVSIAVGDFNGDGRTDVATAEAIIIQVLLSDDQGEFTSITPYLSGSRPSRPTWTATGSSTSSPRTTGP